MNGDEEELPQQDQAVALAGDELPMPESETPDVQVEEPSYEPHEGMASIFANPTDLWRYRQALRNGASEREALKVGDNGVGKWKDVTATYKVPMVALPEDTPGLEHGRLVRVEGPKGSVVARVADVMPPSDKLMGKANIDLNPAAAMAVGHNGGLSRVKWQFLGPGQEDNQEFKGPLPREEELTPIGSQFGTAGNDPTVNAGAFNQWIKTLKPKSRNNDGSITMDDGSTRVYGDLSVVFERGGQHYIRMADGSIKAMPKGTAPPPPDIPIPKGATGEAALEGLTDTQKELARGIANYRLPTSRYLAISRNPQYAQIISRVPLLNPNFYARDYEAGNRINLDFTSGKTANNRKSINQLIGHMDELSQAEDQLGNQPNRIANWVVNEYRDITGDPRPARFETAASAVESELASVFKGTGATDQEIKHWRERVKISQSPAQMKATLDEAIKLMASRLEAIQGQWKSTMGPGAKFPILDPKSADILKRFGHAELTGEYGAGKAPTATPTPTPTAAPQQKASDDQVIEEARRRYKSNPNDVDARLVLQLKGLL